MPGASALTALTSPFCAISSDLHVSRSLLQNFTSSPPQAARIPTEPDVGPVSSVGSSHNRLSSAEDNKEASLLGCPPIGLVDEEMFMVRNQEGLISPGLKHRGFTAHAGEF